MRRCRYTHPATLHARASQAPHFALARETQKRRGRDSNPRTSCPVSGFKMDGLVAVFGPVKGVEGVGAPRGPVDGPVSTCERGWSGETGPPARPQALGPRAALELSGFSSRA